MCACVRVRVRARARVRVCVVEMCGQVGRLAGGRVGARACACVRGNWCACVRACVGGSVCNRCREGRSSQGVSQAYIATADVVMAVVRRADLSKVCGRHAPQDTCTDILVMAY